MRPTWTNPVRPDARRGFTLIELLIVIGVLGILITLGVLGFGRISTQNKQKATYTTLANCASLLKEFAAQANVNTFGNATLSATSFGFVTADNPGGRDAAANESRNRFFNAAWQIPALRKSLENFPQDQRLVSSVPGAAFVPTDAWNNPILFVPAGGLTDVRIDGASRTITAPDGRPFFVSAGADGNFITGDDNVYSFEAP